ncbi:MAG TPA: glycosyltransferase family 39 protein [Prosthecochloris aestuarii]|uniref:Glycosyltransferase family 39 protein n=1 Tax=Prosthecochloris aestuarii TaxID=1102 RepID=A0A831SLW6_PROAE|nr:glycosyltransferase family 39 protein [Prosthecochloris aestuarii]
MNSQSENKGDILILTALCAVSFFFGLGSAPLFDVDEGAFSEATREMLQSGNYLTTYLNGEPRFDKPILIYWLQLISIKLLGISEFAFRLPSALASTLWTGMLYLFTRRNLGYTQAFTATALMMTSLQITIIAKAAIADALLNAMLAISMFAMYSYYERRSTSDLLLAFAAIGLGTLTKGPVAILIPLAVSAIFFISRKETMAWLKAVFNPAGIALFAIIVLPWYILEYLDQGMAFIEGFILKHNVQRFSNPMEKHDGSIWYYIPVVLVGIMPATGMLFTLARQLRPMLNKPLFIYLLTWFLFVFFFFSLSGTKLPHYVIYGYTPLFILIAIVFHTIRRPFLLGILPAILLLAFSALPLIARALLSGTTDMYVQAVLRAAATTLGTGYTLQLVTAALSVAAIWAIPAIGTRYRAALAGAIFCLAVNLTIMPAAGQLLQEPVREAALMARNEGYKVAMWKVNYPSFLVYSENFVEKRQPGPGDIVFTSVKYLDRLPDTEILYSRNGLVLARIPDRAS